jgi:DNA mismatch repair protein MutS2
MFDSVLNPSTRRVLDFDAVLDQVAGYAQSPLGSAATRALAPRPSGAARELGEVAEMREMGSSRGYVPCGSARPIDAIAGRAAVQGAVLDIAELAQVGRTATVVNDVRRHLSADVERWPRLAGLVADVPSLGALIEQLADLFDGDDELRDDASPDLRRIRRALKSARRAVRDRLERMTREPAIARALQEPVVTARAGRLVLPVQAGKRDRVPGVVHDTSSSGQTLFIEPLAAVEAQNRLAELRGAERDEVRRLLAEATAHVRAASPGLLAGSAALARVDSLQGIARWAQENDAVAPEPGDGGIDLRGARHPLLDPDVAVPLDLTLDRDSRALVITGPNTGGKTVALKTLGLAVSLAQCGIPVVATTARLPLFSRVHADIGDEQSLAASLSTFSGHLQKIAAFLADCPPGALVLMDELGTGTDPGEGAALGIALIETFMAADAVVMTSTHHDALKVFAQRTAGVVNAAMEFDHETLAPTYRLQMGRPGRSNALDIAARLGLRPEIVARARELIAADAVELDGVLRELETQERALAQERGTLAARQEALESAAESAAATHAHQAAAYEAAERAARKAVEEAVRDLRARGEAQLEELERRQPATSDRTRADRRAAMAATTGELRRAALDALAAAVSESRPAEGASTAGKNETVAARSRGHDGPPARDTPAPAPGEAEVPPPSKVKRPEMGSALTRGDTVRVEPFGTVGAVLKDWGEGSDRQVEVAVAGKRLVVARGNVVPVQAPAPKPARPRHFRRPRRDDVALELDLHGMRVDEALAAVDKHLDDAILAEHDSVRFIHGFGTLRLRDAIREHLRDRPEVAAFAAADPYSGGEGVTVVRLED